MTLHWKSYISPLLGNLFIQTINYICNIYSNFPQGHVHILQQRFFPYLRWHYMNPVFSLLLQPTGCGYVWFVCACALCVLLGPFLTLIRGSLHCSKTASPPALCGCFCPIDDVIIGWQYLRSANSYLTYTRALLWLQVLVVDWLALSPHNNKVLGSNLQGDWYLSVQSLHVLPVHAWAWSGVLPEACR